MLVISISNKIY